MSDDLFAPPTEEERRRAGRAALMAPRGSDDHISVMVESPIMAPPTDEEREAARRATLHGTDWALDVTKRAGNAALEGFGKASRAIDSYTGAPTRAAVGAVMDSGDLAEAPGAFANQFGEDPDQAPTGKDLAARAGLSTKEDYRFPLVTDPFAKGDGRFERVSPAGVAGVAADMALDPTAYVGIGAAKHGTKAAIKGAGVMNEKLAKHLAQLAGERATKAATGQNVAAWRKIANMKRGGSRDAAASLERARATGQQLLDEGVVRFGDRVEGIAPRATEALHRAGDDIEYVEKAIDTAYPKGIVDGRSIANDIVEFAATIPETEAGKALQKRLLAEAENLDGMGSMTFEHAKKVKGQFKYKPDAQDLLVSSQDATNAIGGIISRAMEDSAMRAAPRIDPKLHEKYLDAKRRYHIHSNVATAANDRVVANQSNRWFSPSDYFTGGTGITAAAGVTHDPIASAVVGAAAGIGNKVLRERGSASVAAIANSVSKLLAKNPARFAKWSPIFETAAASGAGAVALRHHLLMKSDPQYRQAILSSEGTQP